MTLEREEYELGEDVTHEFEPSKAPGIVVSLRLGRDDADRLLRFAAETERTVSQVARLAIRDFLDAQPRRAALHAAINVYADDNFVYSSPLTVPRTYGASGPALLLT